MVGISLEACNFRLQIVYVDDVRFTWYTFEVWIVGWVWHLLWVLFQLWIFWTTKNTCDYLWIRLFVLGISVGIGFYDLLMR